jgi:hypothetical protein
MTLGNGHGDFTDQPIGFQHPDEADLGIAELTAVVEKFPGMVQEAACTF